ncbi:hypothetical protein PVAP13_4NG335901 [Panicum virgatum]|uniref:F-box domain-containing protein n=1 Tax=Panicum virgatum TaxID=38727 RepID=A0A8T0TG51_PANVG|nr:hypothetical protein PVAP13_4NG335901 [Panicum virgatum]
MAGMILDDLIHDILVRLPAAAVLRFRAVCKQWRALVDDHRFPIAHHRHRPPMPLPPVIRFTAPAHQDRRTMIRKGLSDQGDFQVHGSSDGVLLVSYTSGLYLCNPARRRWTKVPTAIALDGIVGFYAHRPSGDFRALHLHRRIDIVYDYRILTLGPTNIFSTRIIAGPHSSEDAAACIRIRPASVSPPALVAGNLHWLPEPDPNSSSDLLVFDPVAETFRRMRPPPAVEAQAQALLELDGRLTMTLTRGDLATAELWVLQDGLRICRYGPDCTNCLLHCDAKGRVRTRHQPEHHRIIAVPRMFRESLLPHSSVNGRQITTGYEGIQFPPFFIHCNCHLHSGLL